jgi:hypothetical protein
MQFTAQVQASVRATANRITAQDLLSCVSLYILTTLTRYPYDNIYEFNNNTLILITMKRLTNIITKINSIMTELGTAAAYAKLMYYHDIITRPDGSCYVQCTWIESDDQDQDLTREQKLTADQLKDWNTTE